MIRFSYLIPCGIQFCLPLRHVSKYSNLSSCSALLWAKSPLKVVYIDKQVVRIDYNPAKVSLLDLLKVFWECHDPTQGMRQGNDIGTQYRSVCYCNNEEELAIVQASLDNFQSTLFASNFGSITTELKMNQKYYLAEEYHQQYLDKNPNGYCGIGGTGCEFMT